MPIREIDGDASRRLLWNGAFGPLYRARPSYQCQDFEIADYRLQPLPGLRSLVRGPVAAETDIRSGRYICVIGAAQLFGRFSPVSFADEVAEKMDLPVLNLSQGGAGPEAFLDPAYRDYISRARLVIVEVLSGRSAGCDLYPGGMATVFEGKRMPREAALKLILERSPGEYRETVQRWARTYVEGYRKIAATIGGKSLLAWVSARRPDQWSIEKGERTGYFGPFPHLVRADVLRELRDAFDDYAEVVYRQPTFGFRSRLTGADAPFITAAGEPQWTTDYYPPPEVQAQIAEAVLAGLSP